MTIIVDLVYLLILPFVLIAALISRFKGHPKRKDLLGRLGHGPVLTEHPKRILLHAVSVGEVNALRKLVPELVLHGYDIVICVTTDTGLELAKSLYGEAYTVTRFPFDLSFAVRRFLNRIKPTIVALVELEVWPNMIGTCAKRGIPILVINGRLSERSFRRYKFAKHLLRSTFEKLTAIGMQNETYAQRVRELYGNNVQVFGTMKWDNAVITDTVDGAEELASDLGIDMNKRLIVAGSTTPEEHELLVRILPDDVQLLCAQRRPEWFDNAAITLSPCNRRTESKRLDTRFFLLDTIGELDKAYSLADIVVIGRSFVPLHGSDPTQAIALGKPTIIGPNVGDFTDMIATLVDGGGIIQCTSDQLQMTLSDLLDDSEQCLQLATAGRSIIQSQQGVTHRYLNFIVESTPT